MSIKYISSTAIIGLGAYLGYCLQKKATNYCSYQERLTYQNKIFCFYVIGQENEFTNQLFQQLSIQASKILPFQNFTIDMKSNIIEKQNLIAQQSNYHYMVLVFQFQSIEQIINEGKNILSKGQFLKNFTQIIITNELEHLAEDVKIDIIQQFEQFVGYKDCVQFIEGMVQINENAVKIIESWQLNFSNTIFEEISEKDKQAIFQQIQEKLDRK